MCHFGREYLQWKDSFNLGEKVRAWCQAGMETAQAARRYRRQIEEAELQAATSEYVKVLTQNKWLRFYCW